MRYLAGLILYALLSTGAAAQQLPRVIIFTDINLVGGDPDDRQSMLHLFWYANELEISGIVPDFWNGKGYEATLEALEKYEEDYKAYDFASKGYPSSKFLTNKVAKGPEDAQAMLLQALSESEEVLYVLIWGQMSTFRNILYQHPVVADRVRVLTIGTGVKYGPRDEVAGEDCRAVNWNGRGRNEIYKDPRFDHMWWLESNWTYNGMFMGEEPAEMYEKLAAYGAMGKHIQTVTSRHPWAHYFRVGDTPTVLYLIDPGHDPDDPESSSWAGRFTRPFPETKPFYFTDHHGPVDWNYEDPCQSWSYLKEMYAYNKSTLHERRGEMYQSLLEKLNDLYGKP